MRLTTLRIRNFRSIEAAEIVLHDFTAIVGPNNSGKTNVLRALQMLLDHRITASDDDFSRFAQRRRNIVIEGDLEFSPGERSVITRRLHRQIPTATLRLTFSRTDATRTESISIAKPRLGHQGETFVLGRIHEWGAVYLIPAVRSAATDFSLDDGSLLRRALAQSVRDTTAGRRNPLQKAVATLGAELTKELERLSIGLKSELDAILTVDALRFAPELRGIVGSMTALPTLISDPLETTLAAKGNGVQSAVALALHQVVTAQTPQGMMLVEEPESYLHPGAQRAVLSRLLGRSSQVVVTTHSPTVIDALPRGRPEAVVRTSRTTTGRTTVASQNWSRASKELLERNVGLRLSEIFFAEGALLVEGPSDREVFEHLAERRHNWALKGYVTIETGGKDSLASGLQICRQLGIPVAVIADKDAFTAETHVLKKLKVQSLLDSAQSSRLVRLASEAMSGTDSCAITEKLNHELHPFGCHALPVDLQYAMPTSRNAAAVAALLKAEHNLVGSNVRREWDATQSSEALAEQLRTFLGAKQLNLSGGQSKSGYLPGLIARGLKESDASECLTTAIDWADGVLDRQRS